MSRSDEVKKNMAASAGLAGGASGIPAAIPKRDLPAKDVGVQRSKDVFDIDLERLVADPDQPRKEFDPDSIRRMAGSLQKRGQLMPITVRWSPSLGKWMVVSGERRFRAATLAGLKSLKAVDRSHVTDEADIQADQLIENLQRDELRGIDAAKGYRFLMDRNGWSANELAKELHLSQPAVVQALAMLETSPVVQEMVALEELSPSAAYELSKIADKEVQEEVAARVVEEGMKRDEVRAEVAKVTAKGGSKNPGKGRGGAARAGARPGKSKATTPWSYRASPGVKVILEFAKGKGRDVGEAALSEALAKFREQHAGAAS